MSLRTSFNAALAAWRAASAAPGAEARLYDVTGEVARVTIVPFRFGEHVSEILASETCHAVWPWIVGGRIRGGAEYTFVERSARNRATNHYHQLRRRQEVPLPGEPDDPDDPAAAAQPLPSPEPDVERQATAEELRQGVRARLLEALEAMPEAPRWVIVRLYVDERSMDELSEERLDAVLGALGKRREELSEEQLRGARRTCQSWVAQNHKRGKAFLESRLRPLYEGEE